MKLKVEESFLSNQGLNEEKEWALYEIYINNSKVFSVKHDSTQPNKNTLFDNFEDCYNILPLLKKFYDYGKENVDIEFKIK